MASVYRVTLVSTEQRGASKPNIIELDFASDADAILFGQNLCGVTAGLSPLCAAQNTSVDHEEDQNYALPYPAGTETSLRAAFWDAAGHTMNMSLANTPASFNENARSAALIATGILMVQNGVVGAAPTSINVQTFGLTPSV